MFDRPLFSVGSRTYSRRDAVAAAAARGEWTAVEDRIRLELACASRAESEDESPEIDLSALVDAFRYDRQLLTAQETEEWLERSALTVESLSAQLERSELRRLWSDEAGTIVLSYPVSDADLAQAVPAALICSGTLERFAWTLADRAAAAEESPGVACADEPVDDAVVTSVIRAIGLVAGGSFSVGDSPHAWRERIAGFSRMERIFQQLARAERTPAALQACVDAHRLDWVRMAWRSLALATEEAAREAALRVRNDGDALSTVADDLGLDVEERHALLCDLDDGLRTALFSARTGALVGPVAAGDRFAIALLDQKIAPSLTDEDVRRQAEAGVTQALAARFRTRIRWHEQP